LPIDFFSVGNARLKSLVERQMRLELYAPMPVCQGDIAI